MAGLAVAVLVVTPEGIPVVRDLRKPSPVFWKLPGGKGEGEELPAHAAVREIREEVGIHLSALDLRVISREDKGTHVIFVFRADLSALPPLRKRGDEGEEVAVFKPRDLLARQDFFPNHRRVVGKILAALA